MKVLAGNLAEVSKPSGLGDHRQEMARAPRVWMHGHQGPLWAGSFQVPREAPPGLDFFPTPGSPVFYGGDGIRFSDGVYEHHEEFDLGASDSGKGYFERNLKQTPAD